MKHTLRQRVAAFMNPKAIPANNEAQLNGTIKALQEAIYGLNRLLNDKDDLLIAVRKRRNEWEAAYKKSQATLRQAVRYYGTVVKRWEATANRYAEPELKKHRKHIKRLRKAGGF